MRSDLRALFAELRRLKQEELPKAEAMEPVERAYQEARIRAAIRRKEEEIERGFAMHDDVVKAEVVHAALLHCCNDRGCKACPMYDECGGDCTVLMREAADVLAQMIHDRKVREYGKQ